MGACARAAAIADEAAVPHEQRAPRYAGQQDAILVVQETHAFDREVHALAANAGAVGVLGACPAQCDAAHSHVVAGDDENVPLPRHVRLPMTTRSASSPSMTSPSARHTAQSS